MQGPQALNIFDIIVAAGLPDPRKDIKFREFLIKELSSIGKVSEKIEETPEKEKEHSVEEKVEELRRAARAIERSKSQVEINKSIDLLIDTYNNGIDVACVLNSDDFYKIEELPKLRN